MRLSIQGIDFQVDISEGKRTVLQICNKKLLRGVIESIHFKMLGGVTNDIVILDEEISLTTGICMIDSLQDIDVNTKKNVNQLYKKIEESLNINYDSKIQIMSFVELIGNLIDDESMNFSFSICRNEDLAISDLLKMFNYKIDCSLTKILDKLYSFVDIMFEFRSYKLLVFLNLSFYLSDSELIEFLGYMDGNKIPYLLIESEGYKRKSNETIYLIDDELFEYVD